MRPIVLNICFLLVMCTAVHSETHVIYVDLSAKSTSMDSTKHRVMRIVQGMQDKNLLAYISKGTEPIKCETAEEIEKGFEKLQYMANPAVPDGFSEVRRLNKFLIKHDLLKGINRKNREVDEDIHFHFFLHPNQLNNYQQVSKIVKNLLLTNRLYDKDGLVNNCHINVYLDCIRPDQEVCNETLTSLKKQYPHYEVLDY